MRKLVINYFYFIALLLPLIFYTKTSELFEFNKMIFIYISTVILLTAWLIDIFAGGKKLITANKTVTYSIIFFLAMLSLSTIISIDFRTSLLGYYSRFHGGLTSYISYSILFFIFINYFDIKSVNKFIDMLLISTTIAALYAGLEHFGYSPSCLIVTGNFNVECWIQDVQNRVFGTFGQPNWLAAWLVAIIPLTWYRGLEFDQTNYKRYLFTLCSILFILVLYYTKSRSGFLAFVFSSITFWISSFYIFKSDFRNILSMFIIVVVGFSLLTIFINTPWQPSIPTVNAEEYLAPVLESGGTESGDIRRIVWRGAWELFKKYPILGTGLDTFAFSYYETRPIEHNMTSEWNYIYNRAHNEYLNFLATTGITGFVSFILLNISFIVIMARKFNLLNISLLSSYSAILITNFFGFSTVGVGFLMFLLPAMSLASLNKEFKSSSSNYKDNNLYIVAILFMGLFTTYKIVMYWNADINYSSAKKYIALGYPAQAIEKLESAIKISPNESVYYSELAKAHYMVGNLKESDTTADRALSLSTHNVAIHKQVANVYSNLSKIEPEYMNKEYRVLEKLIVLAPTDPSAHYQYASLLGRSGNIEESITKLKQTIELKPNYKLANVLLAYLYEDTDQLDLAREQYEYILKFVDPNDEKIKEDLKQLNEK